MFIFPVQQTTSRIGNLTYPVDLYSATCDDHTYIYTIDSNPSLAMLRYHAEERHRITESWCLYFEPIARSYQVLIVISASKI